MVRGLISDFLVDFWVVFGLTGDTAVEIYPELASTQPPRWVGTLHTVGSPASSGRIGSCNHGVDSLSGFSFTTNDRHSPVPEEGEMKRRGFTLIELLVVIAI